VFVLGIYLSQRIGSFSHVELYPIDRKVQNIDSSYLSQRIGSFSHVELDPIDRKVENIDSSTGVLFSGRVTRRFGSSRVCSDLSFTNALIEFTKPQCSRWNVVTTIYDVTSAVQTAAAMSGWCTVIMADRKTPSTYMKTSNLQNNSNVFFLSAQMQEAEAKSRQDSVGAFMRHVPFNHFARKNIGYLYAIAHGAKFIFDFDDDNKLKSSEVDIIPWSGESGKARQVVSSSLVLNVYPLLNPSANGTWPRGFPLELLKKSPNTTICSTQPDVSVSRIGIIQFTADHDPDVDAVYRMTRPIPFDFEDSSLTAIVLPLDCYSPYNAQATLHTKNALWATLLPFTVPDRVSDIWRSFFAQSIFSRIGLQVSFGQPLVKQVRNMHNYLADMNAETDIYFKAYELVKFLSQWHDNSTTVPEAVETLWIALYERTYIERDDVVMMQLWLTALRDSGYVFPVFKLKTQVLYAQPFSHITLLGQFNWQTGYSQADEWVQMWSQIFPVSNIILALPREKQVFRDDSTKEKKVPLMLRYFADLGFYSPMLNLIRAIDESSANQGVLYVHDDMMLSSALLARIGTDEWVITVDLESKLQLLRDGTFQGQLPPSSWYWWKKNCASTFRDIANNPQMDSFWGQDTGLDIAIGQSDMLYVNTRNHTQMQAFTRLLRIFAQHKLFLECAIPSAIAIMKQKYGVRVHCAKLCTTWENSRGNPEKWSCINDKSYDAFHPIKQSAPNWIRFFHDITMS